MTEWIVAYLPPAFGWWLGGSLILVAGFAILRFWKQQQRWRRRGRLQFSLTGLLGNHLRVRPLGEVDCQTLFLSGSAVKRLWRGATATTDDNPLVQLDTDDYRVYLRAVGNYFSGWFAHGHLLLDQGLRVRAAEYVVGIVAEIDESSRGKQLRVVTVARQLLEDLPPQPPILEHESQRRRWQTLQAMAKTWQENPLALTVVEIVLPGQD